MDYLNIKDVLDKAQSKWQDNTATLRTKALIWVNEVIRDLHNEPREWKFLEDTITLTITSNQATLPAGAQQIIYLKGTDSDGNVWFLTMADCLTDAEANALGQDTTSEIPKGFTIAADGTIKFYQGAITSCELKYETDFTTTLEDVDTDTIYPKQFENLLITGTRMHYYDYDKDGRYGKEVILYGSEMSKARAWDNTFKPSSKQSPHGYTRVSN